MNEWEFIKHYIIPPIRDAATIATALVITYLFWVYRWNIVSGVISAKRAIKMNVTLMSMMMVTVGTGSYQVINEAVQLGHVEASHTSNVNMTIAPELTEQDEISIKPTLSVEEDSSNDEPDLDMIDLSNDDDMLVVIDFDPNDGLIGIDGDPSVTIWTPIAPEISISLTPVPVPTKPVDTTPTTETCVVQVRETLTANANIREGYSLNTRVLTSVARGTLLAGVSHAAEYGDGDVWYEVTTIDGITGWIFGNLISLDGCDAPRFITVPTLEPSVEPTPIVSTPIEPTIIVTPNPTIEVTPNPTEPTIEPSIEPTPTEPTVEPNARPIVFINTPYNGQVIYTENDTRFEATAYDPDYGTYNGANIAQVEFNIYDTQGNLLYYNDEQHVRYCAGRGDNECFTIPFLLDQAGTYTITAQAWDNDGQVSDLVVHIFIVADTSPTLEPTTITPEPTATVETTVIAPEPSATPSPDVDNAGDDNADNNDGADSDDEGEDNDDNDN